MSKGRVRLDSGPMQTERLPSGRRKFLRDIVITVDGVTYTIPAGSETDFSTRGWLGRLVMKWSKVDLAGAFHDRLYYTAEVSRAKADKLWQLVAVAGEHSANCLQGWVGYVVLRSPVGWWAWRRHRKREDQAY